MKFKYLLTAILLLNICFYSASNIAEAKCEDSRKVINLTREVIKNPTARNIDSYISTMKKRAIVHGIKQDYEAQADDFRSILYFLRKNKKSEEYIKYYQKLCATYSKLGFKNSQSNKLEIARNLYLENKYFASAYEFLELAQEGYCKEICYEFLGDISQSFNNPEAALVFYKKALEVEPENYCVTYKIGKVYKYLNKDNEAKEYFETTINLTEDPEILNDIVSIYEKELKANKDNEASYEILGLAYQKLKEYRKTYNLFKKAITLKPDDIFLKYYLGNLLFDMGEYAEAIKIYNSIILNNPYETQIRIARAKSLKALNRANDALKDYQVVLALYPDSKQAQIGIFKLFSGKKRAEEIVKLFYPLNKNFAPNADFYNNLAGLLYSNGFVSDAVNLYKASIKLAPKKEKTYISLYKIYELEGQTAPAYELAQEAHKNLPNSPEIKKIYQHINKNASSEKNLLALSYMSNKEYIKAIKIYNQIHPKTAAVYESISNCYKAQKNYKAAVDALLHAIKLDPVNSDLYYSTALLYLDLNSKKTAETYLEKAIGLDRKNLKARKLLSYLKQQEIDNKLDRAYALYQKKDYKNTLVELIKAEKLYPNNPEVYYYKALTYNALNDINNAYRHFMKTLELDRSYYTAHFYIAEILEKRGKEKQALEEYEWFLGADVKDAKMMKKAQDKVIKLGQKYY